MGNCLFQKIFIYNEQIQGQSLTFKSIFNTIKLNENDLNKLFTGIFVLNFYFILILVIYDIIYCMI